MRTSVGQVCSPAIASTSFSIAIEAALLRPSTCQLTAAVGILHRESAAVGRMTHPPSAMYVVGPLGEPPPPPPPARWSNGDSYLRARHPKPKVSAPAHANHQGWHLEFEVQVTRRTARSGACLWGRKGKWRPRQEGGARCVHVHLPELVRARPDHVHCGIEHVLAYSCSWDSP